MKKIILISISLLFLTSCERRFNQAMKSTDKDYIFKVAEYYESKKKYTQAIALYEQAVKYTVGTDDAPEIAYRGARLNYLDGNYRLAAHQFKNFVLSYPRDPRADDAAYMAAYCYYENSPDYNLDQTSTYDALRELQAYINMFPNSDKVQYCNKMIDNLNKKLEKKAFENAKTLYKITEYKGAIIAFENVLNDFPSTEYKEEVMIYDLRARTELAVNSIHRLKKERILNGKKSYDDFVAQFPHSKYLDEAKRLSNRVENARESYESTEKSIQEGKAMSKAKAHRLEKENNHKID